MRDIVWQRVDEASAQPNPGGWSFLPVPDDEIPAIRQAVLEEGMLPATAKIYVLLPAPASAYQRHESVQQLPSGRLTIKAVATKRGRWLCSSIPDKGHTFQ
ncbi:hypothetical protein WJX74_003100 [Apatococcus lobatus]|uniref:Uncharacterized protein n=1 Tax=Apatococcus lobatus TaxID=904363 RepID=A0AAW1RYN8_9CHLO